MANAKSLARQLDQQNQVPLCSNISVSGVGKDSIDPKKPQKDFELMYEGLTAHIHQFIASVAQFQHEHRPIFERVYIQTRKVLFDFFGTSIDVL